MLKDSYKKYKWFVLSSGAIVVGGKSASQNDLLLKEAKKEGVERVVMHTSHPGSPFCVILKDAEKVSKGDVEECAVFCGAFSRAWKLGKEKTEVHIFKLSQLSKSKGMKTGTWKVGGEIKRKIVLLELVLAKQKDVLRAVPEKSVAKKDVLLKVAPGRIDKKQMMPKFAVLLNEGFSVADIDAALPAGGVRVL